MMKDIGWNFYDGDIKDTWTSPRGDRIVGWIGGSKYFVMFWQGELKEVTCTGVLCYTAPIGMFCIFVAPDYNVITKRVKILLKLISCCIIFRWTRNSFFLLLEHKLKLCLLHKIISSFHCYCIESKIWNAKRRIAGLHVQCY